MANPSQHTNDEAIVSYLEQILPDEVLIAIFLFLSPRDLCAIAETCARLRQVARDNYLWKWHFLNNFPNEAKRFSATRNKVENYHSLYVAHSLGEYPTTLFKNKDHERKIILRKAVRHDTVNEFHALRVKMELNFADLLNEQYFTKNLLDYAASIEKQSILDYLFHSIKNSRKFKKSDTRENLTVQGLTLSAWAILCRQHWTELLQSDLYAVPKFQLPNGEAHSHLSLAISRQCEKIVDYFLEETGVPLELSNPVQCKIKKGKRELEIEIKSLLAFAVYSGNIKILESLLNYTQYFVEYPHNLCNTKLVKPNNNDFPLWLQPLMIACLHGDINIAQALTKKYPEGTMYLSPYEQHLLVQFAPLSALRFVVENFKLPVSQELFRYAKKHASGKRLSYLRRMYLSTNHDAGNYFKVNTGPESLKCHLKELCEMATSDVSPFIKILLGSITFPFLLLSSPWFLTSDLRRMPKEAFNCYRKANPTLVRGIVLNQYPGNLINQIKGAFWVKNRNSRLISCLNAFDTARELCKDAENRDQATRFLKIAMEKDREIYQLLLLKVFALPEKIITIDEKQNLAQAAGYASLASVLPDIIEAFLSSLLILQARVMNLFAEQSAHNDETLSPVFNKLNNYLCEACRMLDEIKLNFTTKRKEIKFLNGRVNEINQLLASIQNKIKETEALEELIKDVQRNFSSIQWLSRLAKNGYHILQAAVPAHDSEEEDRVDAESPQRKM